MTRYKNHPAADLFPMIEGKAWEDFKQDIRTNGFQQDITLYRGQILDGRNRYKAAIELKMLDDLGVCEFDEDSDIDPYQWVISRNLHRRHLTESQRASVAAKLVNVKLGENQHTLEGLQICRPTTVDQAAQMLQVSPRSVHNAKAVLEHGSPELIAAVERGEVAVSRAATVAKTIPKEKQIDEAKKKPKKKEDKQKKKTEEKAGKPKSVAVQKQERDADWVRDFVHSMSRISRLKLLLKEITDSERQILKDWLSEK